eukprot:1362698-Amorphochlora_amoeboformis.AAC.1
MGKRERDGYTEGEECENSSMKLFSLNKRNKSHQVKDHKTGKNYILAKSRLPFLYRGLGGGKKAPENGGGGAGKKKRKKNVRTFI